MDISHPGVEPPAPAPAEYFTGTVTMERRFQRAAPARISGAVVTFQPSARTAWHTHPLGQTLIVTAGSGLVQREGEPVQAIGVGDIVWIPPDVRHWHGASPASAMTHVALAEMRDGVSVVWQEKVTDAEYNAP